MTSQDVNKMDGKKYIKDGGNEGTKEESEQKTDSTVEVPKGGNVDKLKNAEKKYVTFDLENEGQDIKDNEIQVEVNNAITTLNLVMESPGKISAKIDDDYINFPSSQKDTGKYSVVTEDISDDEKDKKEEENNIRKNNTEVTEDMSVHPMVEEHLEQKPENEIEIKEDDIKEKEKENAKDSEEDKVNVEDLPHSKDEIKHLDESEAKETKNENRKETSDIKSEPTIVKKKL